MISYRDRKYHRHSEAEIRTAADKANLDWLAGDYESVNSKLLMGCRACFKRSWKTARSVLRSYLCRGCAMKASGPKRRMTEEEARQMLGAAGLDLLEYGGACMSKSLVRCALGGHEFAIRPNDVSQGHGCRQCHTARQRAVSSGRRWAVARTRATLAGLIRYIKDPDYVGMPSVICPNIGCSRPFFKKYVESLFQSGMNWTNWGKGEGKWNLDHIKPLKSFDVLDPAQLLIANHYTNLQPLWAKDNLRKGSKLLPKITVLLANHQTQPIPSESFPHHG